MMICLHMEVTGKYIVCIEDALLCLRFSSLSATSIRSSVQLALRKSKQVPVLITRALPANFAYDFPTITSLSAFVYGVLLVAGTSGNMGADQDDEEDEIFDWGSISPTSTIVKLRSGKGEPPLIVVHGKSPCNIVMYHRLTS
jgi:hypothetical protein